MKNDSYNPFSDDDFLNEVNERILFSEYMEPEVYSEEDTIPEVYQEDDEEVIVEQGFSKE